MRKLFMLLVCLPILLVNCKKDLVAVNFKMNFDTDFTIESGSLVDIPFNIFTPDVTTNSEAQFEENDTRKDKVTEIKLNFLDLEITNPGSATFSFLKHIYIYINADGLDEVLLASKENIDNNTRTLILDIEDVNFAEHIKKDKFTLRVKTVTDQVLGQDVDVHADMQFAVKATLIK